MNAVAAEANTTSGLTRVAGWLLAALFVGHFIVLATYAVNLPYWDEWDIWRSPQGSTLGWLFSQSNEHRPVFTRLEILLVGRWGPVNLATLILVHFQLFGLLILGLLRTARLAAAELPQWAAYTFCAFLLTSMPWEVHFWALASVWVLSLLFFVTAASCLFHQSQRLAWLVLGGVLVVLSFFANSTGLISGLVLSAWFGAFKLTRAWRATSPAERKRELAGLAVVTAVVVPTVLLWMSSYVKPAHHPPLQMPFHLAFWDYFLNLVAYGFGFETNSVALGVGALLVVAAPLALEFWKRRGNPETRFWWLSAVVLGLLGTAGGIAMARVGLGADSKIPRYAIVVTLFVPLAAMSWSVALGTNARGRAAALLAVGAFAFVGFSDNWTIQPYRAASATRRDGAECVRRALHKGSSADCPMIFPLPISDALTDLYPRLSFYDELGGAPRGIHGRYNTRAELLAAFPEDESVPEGQGGYIDTGEVHCLPRRVCDPMVAGGWAVDPLTKQPAPRVWLLAGDKVLATTQTGNPRVDVAAALKAEQASYSGFRVTIDGDQLEAEAEPLDLTGYALTSDGGHVVKIRFPPKH